MKQSTLENILFTKCVGGQSTTKTQPPTKNSDFDKKITEVFKK